jgi:serine/threonine protein kinase/tetratricopeptide (TPR) repeat protein
LSNDRANEQRSESSGNLDVPTVEFGAAAQPAGAAGSEHGSIDTPHRVAGHVLLTSLSAAGDTRQRYTMSKLYAKGGNGQVWLASDADLGREVALKELRPESAANPAVAARFLDEAQITGRLEHPGIVPVYELVRPGAEGHPYHTMRFVRGRTLSEAVRAYRESRRPASKKVLELRELVNALVAVCNAIAYAHSRGGIHRDLKGQNLVLGDYGEVIVLDWGRAKVKDRSESAGADSAVAARSDEEGDEQTRALSAAPGIVQASSLDRDFETAAGQVLGTPAYMAPEQAAGDVGRIDERTDVYGLGAILYEILCGGPPFVGADTRAVLREVVYEPPVRPRALDASAPPPLEAICLAALSKQPADRYPSAAAMAEDLRRWLADQPVSVYAEPLAVRLGRWVRRHRTLVSTSAGLLVMAVLALAVTTALVGREQKRTEARRQEAVAAREQADRNAIAAKNAEAQALANAEQARRSAQAASEQSELALDALKTFSTEVQNELREQPQLTQLRQSLLEASLERLSKVERTGARGGLADRTRTSVLVQMGELCINLGRIPEAREHFAEANRLARELSKAEPDSDKARGNLTVTIVWLAALGSPDEALALYGEALSIQEELVRIPLRGELSLEGKKVNLANFHDSLGQLLLRQGQAVEALEHFERALALREELEAAGDDTLELKRRIADSCLYLGNVSFQQKNLPDQTRFFERAVALRAELVAAKPLSLAYRQDLANQCGQIGDKQLFLGRPDAALPFYEQGLTESKEIFSRDT